MKTAFRSHPLTTPSLTFRLWSSGNQIVGVVSRSRRTKPITKRGNVHSDWLILPLLLPTPTIWFSLDHKRNVSDGVVSGVGRKWKRSDSSDSDYVALMTPLTTPIFDFHQVISALKKTEFDWKFLLRIAKNIHNEKLIVLFFTRKVSTVIFIERG